MTRATFDPSKVRGPQAETLFQADERHITVSRLTRMIKAAVVDALPAALNVVGEVSNFKRHTASGHYYFTLKDADSQIGCVMWRSRADRVKFRVEDGMEVVAGGRVDVYEARGQVQFYCDRLDPRGVGALELAFRQLRERLAGEGLFDPARKKPIPAYPRGIAVVTSPTGAAIRDFVQTVRRRFPPARVLVYPVRVQGEGSAEEIARAVGAIDRERERLLVDVLVLARGGGSIEDLWVFNEERVARAIHAAAVPIVSGVGHETDVTIADLVADLRAPTPTGAAELVVPALDDVLDNLEEKSGRLRRGLRARLDLQRGRLARIEAFELFSRPLDIVNRQGQRLDEVGSRLHLALRRAVQGGQRRLHRLQLILLTAGPQRIVAGQNRRIDALAHRLDRAQVRHDVRAERAVERLASRLDRASPAARVARHGDRLGEIERRMRTRVVALVEGRGQRLADLEARLKACGPDSVLKRGFTVTRNAKTGKLVRTAGELRPGQRISTEFADGRRESRVLDDRQLELFSD